MLSAVPVFADSSSALKNGIYHDDDGEIRYYVDGVATYAGVVVDKYGNYYYFNSSCTAVRSQNYGVGKTNGLIEERVYYIDENGHIVNPVVIQPDMDDVYYLERIYILLFILTAFTICGIFIARPRRWI